MQALSSSPFLCLKCCHDEDSSWSIVPDHQSLPPDDHRPRWFFHCLHYPGLSSAPANPLSSTLLRSWLILAQFFASVFNIFHISYKSFFIFFVLILNFCFLVLSLLVPVAVVRFKLFCIFFSLLVEKLELDLNFSCSLLPFPDSKSSHRMAGPRPIISTHPRNPQDV